MAYSLLDGYQTCEQTNQDVAQTMRMTVRAPRIANRLFQTLQQAQDFVDICDDTASACRGLIVSVFDDSASTDNNGLYVVSKVKENSGDTPGILEPIGKCDCPIKVLHVDNIDVALAPYHDEDIYFCVVSGLTPTDACTTYNFIINDKEQQMLWFNLGYGTRYWDSLSSAWSAWKWTYYTTDRHTHISEHITDSLTSLPASAADKTKLVQAGALEAYIAALQGVTVPTVDHMLIYSEDNMTLIPKPFMLPNVYVVTSKTEEEMCKSSVSLRTKTENIQKEWIAYSNSQNMPEYGCGVSWNVDTYKPVGYSQGFGDWVTDTNRKTLETDGFHSGAMNFPMAETNGYMSPSKSNDVRLENVIGSFDNTPINIASGNTSGHTRGIWLVNTNEAAPRRVVAGGKVFYRNSLYDKELRGTSEPFWRAWATKPDAAGETYVIYSDSLSCNTVSGGTSTFSTPNPSFYEDNFPSGGTPLVFSGETFTERHTPIRTESAVIVTDTYEASGVIYALQLGYDNYRDNMGNENTVTIKTIAFELPTRFIGRVYSTQEDSQGAITVVSDKDENILANSQLTIVDEASGKTLVPFDYSSFSAGRTSLIKSNIIYKDGFLTVDYTNVNSEATASLDAQIADTPNWQYNGSKVEIDFDARKFVLTDYNKQSTTPISLPQPTNSIWSKFTSGNTLNVLYESQGSRYSLFKTAYTDQEYNIILNIDEIETSGNPYVLYFNQETWQYEKSGATTPLDYMHGSHMAYNDITNTLWYSNGTEIYPIITSPGYHTHVSSAITDSLSALTEANSASTELVQGQAVINYFDDNIPKEYHRLIYTEDVNNKKSLISKGFMYDGECNTDKIYVVTNDTEWSACTGVHVDEPNLIDDWQQFSYSDFSPEYGIGLSKLSNRHTSNTGSTSNGFGYGRWSGSTTGNNIILNPINSNDYNGYMSAYKSDNHDFTSVIGCSKGDTTGDWLGVALVNDENAVPRRVETSAYTYYRNTLYDLDYNNRTPENGWCAWVRFNGNTAYAIYSDSTSYTGNQYKDLFPSGVTTEYFISDISSKHGRTSIVSGDTVEITSTHESEGFIAVLNVMTVNTGPNIYRMPKQIGTYTPPESSRLTEDLGGTIYVFTQIYRLDSGHGRDYKNYANEYLGDTQAFRIIDGGSNDLGQNIVKYIDKYNQNSSTVNSFIKSHINFNGGVLTMEFSDVVSGTTNNGNYEDFLSSSSTIQYNGSKLTIDFKNRNYTVKSRNDLSVPITITSGLTDYNPIVGVSETPLSNGWDLFTGNTKVMYFAFSEQYLVIKSSGIGFQNRTVIDVGSGGTYSNTVYRYNVASKQYELAPGAPINYFYGSHMAYNDITQRLWYSNGTEIYEVKANGDDSEVGWEGEYI